MPSFRSERRVRHRAEQMFDLVADVERYPEFVPLCTSLKVRNRRPDGQGRETLIADMSVGYKMIRERFTSRVVLDKPRLRVVVEYIDGPFSHMENIWTFRDEAGRRALDRHLLHRLRIPQPDARRADGLDVRRRLPQVRAGLRGAGGRGLRADAVAAITTSVRVECERQARIPVRPRDRSARQRVIEANRLLARCGRYG